MALGDDRKYKEQQRFSNYRIVITESIGGWPAHTEFFVKSIGQSECIVHTKGWNTMAVPFGKCRQSGCR